MEAVCYAEQLRQIERTQNRYEKQIEKIQSAHKPLTDEEAMRIRAEVLQHTGFSGPFRPQAHCCFSGRVAIGPRADVAQTNAVRR